MGCCNSKEDHEEDDVRAPLLNNDLHTDSRMNYQTHETIDVKQEQQFWKDVIERTTQNLIDISSSQTDPLQEQDIQERTEKYHDLLQQIPYIKPAAIGKKRSSYYGKVNGMTISNGSATNGSLEAATQSPATGTNASAMTAATTSPPSFELDSSTIDSILATAKLSSQVLSQEQLQWLDQAVTDVENALSKIEVQPVGDMVIHLTMPSNASLHSY